MTPESFKKFVANINSVGIYSYEVRCQSGGRILYNTDKKDVAGYDITGKISVDDNDNLISVEMTRVSVKPERTFNVTSVPITNCDSVSVLDIPTDKAKDIIKAYGLWDEEWEQYFKNISPKMAFRIEADGSNAGLKVLKDKDGNPILPKHSSGMITG